MKIPSDIWYEKEEENENTPHTEDSLERPLDIEQKLPELELDAETRSMSREDSKTSIGSVSTEEESIKEINVDVNDTPSVLDCVAGVNKLPVPQSEMQISDVPVRMQTSLSLTHTHIPHVCSHVPLFILMVHMI